MKVHACCNAPLAELSVVPLATLVRPSPAFKLQLAANQTRVNCAASQPVSLNVSGGSASGAAGARATMGSGAVVEASMIERGRRPSMLLGRGSSGRTSRLPRG